MKRYETNQTKSKIGIVIAMLLIVGGMLTCQLSGPDGNSEVPVADTVVLNTWKKEKVGLILGYESRLKQLSAKQDSISAEIRENKKLLTIARSKTKAAQLKIESLLVRSDTGVLVADSIRPFIDSLAFACEDADSLCTVTINTLEAQIDSKNSSMFQQAGEISILKQMSEQQELHIGNLRTTLDIKVKAEKNLSRKNKLLSAGIILLSGITSSLLITRTLR